MHNYSCLLSSDRRWHFVWQPTLEGYFLGIYTEPWRMPIYFPVKSMFLGHFDLWFMSLSTTENEEIWAFSHLSNKWKMHEMMNEWLWWLAESCSWTPPLQVEREDGCNNRNKATVKLRLICLFSCVIFLLWWVWLVDFSRGFCVLVNDSGGTWFLLSETQH